MNRYHLNINDLGVCAVLPRCCSGFEDHVFSSHQYMLCIELGVTNVSPPLRGWILC
jgi:hypothetical protein